MGNRYKINFFIWIFYRAGNRFRNFIFRKRLGKKKRTAEFIFFIMSIFGYFESKVYINTGETGKFDHFVAKFLLNRWRVAETGIDKGQIFCWSKTRILLKK